MFQKRSAWQIELARTFRRGRFWDASSSRCFTPGGNVPLISADIYNFTHGVQLYKTIKPYLMHLPYGELTVGFGTWLCSGLDAPKEPDVCQTPTHAAEASIYESGNGSFRDAFSLLIASVGEMFPPIYKLWLKQRLIQDSLCGRCLDVAFRPQSVFVF